MNQRTTFPERPALEDMQQNDVLCDRFEKAWRTGRRPDLAAFLAAAPAGIKAQLFHDLLSLDLEYRRQQGEHPEVRSYCERFPEFQPAIATAFESHSAKLTGIRIGQDQLTGDSTVDSATEIGGEGNDHLSLFPDQSQGIREAGYEIQGELGRGGMGVVFMAHQIALNRAVALKVVKSGSFASEAELMRFQNEAEAVAQLDHPHIVPIYEVSRCRGQHFFSMKLVTGKSLDKRLDEYASNYRAAARLLATVAHAVHHAHSRGILHRDLKPANVLVDEQGEPHVTDFGLAKRLKAIGESTQSGALLGTPSYMAPEQASGARSEVSTATDVYGLGTILYALLAGRAPFAGTTLVDTLEKVRFESPEPPSLLNAGVPRDLEVICLKCLEKEPQRRYQSALALAEDVERWLGGIPILARPASLTSRAIMWCRRNPALATLEALLIIVLFSGVAGIAWKWHEAAHERGKAEAVNELLIKRLLAQASLEQDPLGRNLTVRELLDRTVARLGGWLEDQPDVEASIRETIAGAYLSLGQNDQAAPQLQEALRLDTKLYGPRHRDTLRATNLMTALLDRTGRGPDALALARNNLETAKRSLGATDPITLDSAERLGTVLWHLGKTDDAEAVLRKNVDDRSRVLKPEHPDTLRSVYILSRVLRDRGMFADAERFAYSYARSIQCSLGGKHPEYIVALTNQADVFRAKSDLVQAERYYGAAAQEAHAMLGADDPVTRAADENHARALREIGGPSSDP
jgi:predicted Ser/Thr protein kinase